MSLAQLQSTAWRIAWLLEVGGVRYRWYGGPVGCRPPTTAVPGATSVDYGDVEAIVEVGQQSDRLAEMGGVSQVGGLTVTLASRGAQAGAGDPASVFLRTGHRGVTAAQKAKLTTTIEHGTTVSGSVVYVDRSLSGWPTISANRYLFFIGAECFQATGTASGPDRFTGVTRGVALSRNSQHTVDPARSLAPWVTAHPTTWAGRFARLRAAHVTGKALVDADYVEVLRGIVDTDPDVSDDGLSVTVHLAPLTAVLKYKVGGDQQTTRLLHGWHRFTAGVASEVVHAQVAEPGAVYADTCAAAYVGPGQEVRHALTHAAYSDDSLDDGHPRRLPITFGNGGPSIDVTHPGAPDLDLAQAPTVATSIGIELTNALAVEVKAFDLSTLTQPVAWPHAALEAIAGDWSPGVVAGATGAWVDVRPSADGPNGPVVNALINADIQPAHYVALHFRADWSSVDERYVDAASSLAGNNYRRDWSEVAWYGLDFADPQESARWAPTFGGASSEAVVEAPPWTGARGWSRVVDVDRYREGDVGGQSIPIRGIADAFYQVGEPVFLAEDHILGTGVAGSQYVRVKWHEGGEELSQCFPVTAVAVQNNPDGNAVGYAYTLSETVRLGIRSFGDWPGEPRAEIRAAAVFSSDPPLTVLLQLLHSGRGNGANDSTWDNMPFGGNLRTEDVDQGSFERRSASGIADTWTFVVADEATVEEHVSPVLRATGASLAMRVNPADGTSRLTLVPVGHEHELDTVATITSGDLLVDGRPTTSRDSKCVTKWVLELNFGRDGKPGLVVTYNDTDAIGERGGDNSGSETIKLKGLEVGSVGDALAEHLDLIQGLRKRFGTPRVKYRFSMHGGWAFKLAIGDVIKLTAPDAFGYDGSRGIVALPMRITARTVDWMGGRVEVEAVSYAVKTSGYAPAMRVATVVSGTEVTVSANAFSSATHPTTGATQKDVDFFAVSDAVYCVPRGNWSGKTARTIATIAGNNVTFSGAHGLAVGDTVRPQPFDSVSAALKLYAYVADSTGTLGAGGVAGYQYA